MPGRACVIIHSEFHCTCMYSYMSNDACILKTLGHLLLCFLAVCQILQHTATMVCTCSGHRLAKTVRTHDKYMRVMSNDMRCFKDGVVRGRACMFC